MKMERSLLALVAFFSLLGHRAEADCGVNPLLDTTVITPSGASVAEDGGFLVAQLPPTTRTPQPKAQQAYTVRGATTKQRTLAPGLVVYGVKSGGKAQVELVDGDGTTVSRATIVETKRAPYPAPTVTAAYRNVARRYRIGVKYDLKDPVPASTYAMIVVDAKGVPMSFIPVTPGAKEVIPSGSDCQADPDGTRIAQQGDKVVVYWVSTTGRVSAKSKPIKVAGNAP